MNQTDFIFKYLLLREIKSKSKQFMEIKKLKTGKFNSPLSGFD